MQHHRPAIAIVIFTLLASAPFAVAQDHEHGDARLQVRHDAPADGRQLPGGYGVYGWVLFDDAGAPARHNDGMISLTLNGVTLFESASLHDYDGVVSLETGWAVPGTYEVRAMIPGGGESNFTGYVDGSAVIEPATLDVDVPPRAASGVPTTFTYGIMDASEVLIPHTDVLVEVFRVFDDFPVARVHTHTHEEMQELTLSFIETGDYLARFTAYQAYPTVNARSFAPFVTEATFSVGIAVPSAAPAALAAPVPAAKVARTDAAAAPHHSAGDFALQLTADPDFIVGPMTPFRSAAVVTNTTSGELVPHVDFEALVTAPDGRVVMASDTLHEYDGVFEFLTTNAVPGDYTVKVTATRGAWTAAESLIFKVVPPAAAVPVVSGGGRFTIQMDGLDGVMAGETRDVVFRVANEAGVPLAHSEIEVAVFADPEDPLLYRTKLHTHGDGLFHATMTFPTDGEYVIRVDAFPLLPSPAVAFFGSGLSVARTTAIEVLPGPGIPVPEVIPMAEADEIPMAAVPTASPLAVLVGIAGVAWATRRK